MKQLFAILLAAAVPMMAAAQSAETLTFTRIDRNPRTSALAGAGAASVSNVAYASFTNAAVVPFYGKTLDVAAGYQYWAPALGAASGLHLGVSGKVGIWGVTGGILYQAEQPDVDGFRPGELQANLGAGVRFTDWLGLGLNLRYARQALFAGKSISGYGMDLMLLARPVKGLTLTGGVAGLGTSVKDASGNSYSQPASVKLAGAYALTFAEQHTVEVMMDADYYLFGKSVTVSAGLEYNFKEMVYARAGYRRAAENAPYPTHLGVGLGVQFFGVRLDVSYLTASEVIGNSLAVGLGYRF